MAKRRRGRNISGIIILDKPQGESSNRSLQKVKRLLNASKAGHTGSLDPLATGVLPLCFGEATKISQFLLDSDKSYQATIKLGVKTSSGDSEADIVAEKNVDHITKELVSIALNQFRGEIEQIPSMYSALKHEGVPLYKLARQGKTVDRKKRVVTIYKLNLLSFTNNNGCCEIKIEVHCSKGTYIRSIADDLGDDLAVGGHVIALRRLKAGPFTLNQSVSFESLEALVNDDDFSKVDDLLIPPDQAILALPKVLLPMATAAFMKLGQAVIVSHLPIEGLVRLYDENTFIGIGSILDDGRVTPKRLFNFD